MSLRNLPAICQCSLRNTTYLRFYILTLGTFKRPGQSKRPLTASYSIITKVAALSLGSTAIMGDVFFHGPRLDDVRHYLESAPTYIYRFNTRSFINSTNATYINYTGSLAPLGKT